MDDAAVSEWRESFFVSANGVPYSESHRVSAMNAVLTHGGSFRASARDARCSPSTLCRYVQRYAREGNFGARERTGGQTCTLSAADSHFLQADQVHQVVCLFARRLKQESLLSTGNAVEDFPANKQLLHVPQASTLLFFSL